MKNMSKRSLFVIAGCLLLVLGWWSCYHRTDTAQSSPSTGGGRRGGAGGPGGPVPVVAGKVEQKDVPIFLDGLGTVQAFNTVTVRPRVDGELTQVLFREGEDVKTGDLLAVVDPRPYQAAMDQAVAKKAQDEAQLGNAQVVFLCAMSAPQLTRRQIAIRPASSTTNAPCCWSFSNNRTPTLFAQPI